MEIFVWSRDAICREHRRLFPKLNSEVKIRLPALSPQIELNTVCQCQNTQCSIRQNQACSGRAIIIGLSPNLITPEKNFIKPLVGFELSSI